MLQWSILSGLWLLDKAELRSFDYWFPMPLLGRCWVVRSSRTRIITLSVKGSGFATGCVSKDGASGDQGCRFQLDLSQHLWSTNYLNVEWAVHWGDELLVPSGLKPSTWAPLHFGMCLETWFSTYSVCLLHDRSNYQKEMTLIKKKKTLTNTLTEFYFLHFEILFLCE